MKHGKVPDGWTQDEWDAMRERGATSMIKFADGRIVDLVPQLWGQANLCLMRADPDPGYYDDVWCYVTALEADICMCAWDGEGEPTGWFRHPATGRRRPNGNPEQEYVRE